MGKEEGLTGLASLVRAATGRKSCQLTGLFLVFLLDWEREEVLFPQASEVKCDPGNPRLSCNRAKRPTRAAVAEMRGGCGSRGYHLTGERVAGPI